MLSGSAAVVAGEVVPRSEPGHVANLAQDASDVDRAEAVLWLCSGKSSFMTGHYIVLDGGMLAGPNP